MWTLEDFVARVALGDWYVVQQEVEQRRNVEEDCECYDQDLNVDEKEGL